MWISKQEYDESGPSIVHRKYAIPALPQEHNTFLLTILKVLLSVIVDCVGLRAKSGALKSKL